jgi:hypothetical protein
MTLFKARPSPPPIPPGPRAALLSQAWTGS